MAPSPTLIFDALQAHVRTDALKAAIQLKLFTAIADGASTPSDLAARCHASPKGIRVLCDFMTITGFLTKDASGSYGLTPDSSLFLVESSPAYMGGIAEFILHPYIKNAFDDLAGTVRNGGTLLADQGTVSPDNAIWVDFAKGMMPMMMPQAQYIASLTAGAGPLKVLDLAAGHGLFGLMIAQRNPEAQIYAVDWKKVLAVAAGNAMQFRVRERWHAIEGDAFKVDYGTGYDLALVTNFIHHFDVDTNVGFMKKIRAALKPGGKIAILEFAVNDDRITPPGAGTFAMTMLASTQSGDAFTYNEIESMCKDAGFSGIAHHLIEPTPQSVTIAIA